MPARPWPVNRMSPWNYDEAQARNDLDDLARLLAPRTPLSEKNDILPFFQAHGDLCALMNVYNPRDGLRPCRWRDLFFRPVPC